MRYIKWPRYQKDVIAITTTKAIGNVAFQVGDDKEEVLHARAQILNDLDIDASHLIFTHQSHSTTIKKVDETNFGQGQNNFESGVEADGLYTTKANIALGIFHADCVPIFIYVPTHHLVGIIHAGYKGTLLEASKKMIHKIIHKEHIKAEDIYVYIGPYLGKDGFNLSKDEKSNIEAMGYGETLSEDFNDICHIDIGLMNILQLESEGILRENISITPYDTGKDEFLYSAQKSHPIGRMASIIMLKE